MQLSKTDIANSALALLGDMQITSIENQDNSYARIIKPQFNICLNSLAELHDWTFLRKEKKLEEVKYSPLINFKYAYQLPMDFLRFCEQAGRERDFIVSENYIFSNIENLVIAYIKQPYEITHLSPLFVQAFIYKLAGMIAPALNANLDISSYFDKMYTHYVRRAIDADNRNFQNVKYSDDALTLARYSENFTSRPTDIETDVWGESHI